MLWLAIGILLPLLSSAYGSVLKASSPLPLVIWHGLGDNYDSSGIRSIRELYNELYPDAFVHSIQLASTPSGDRTATFLGDVNKQLSIVCDQLKSIPELASGFNALGFSQGGVFLRGYVERCNTPRVHTLLTFGSPHNGIAEFSACEDKWSWVCAVNPWLDWVQSSIVPAQYFRDPADLDTYRRRSKWLADVNNELVDGRNKTYAVEIGSLERLVLVMFRDDTLLRPKQSAWWSELDRKSGKAVSVVKSNIYIHDWLGLKTLGDSGRLEFVKIPGEHMRFEDGLISQFMKVYYGPEGKKAELDWKGVEKHFPSDFYKNDDDL